MDAFSCTSSKIIPNKLYSQGNPGPTPTVGKEKFLIAGLMASEEFQKCQALATKIHELYPEKYVKPEIRPMLNVEWENFALKMKRKQGGGLWKSKSLVLVFLNGVPFGDDKDFIDYISQSYHFSLRGNYTCMGESQLESYFRTMKQKGRRFVTLSFFRANTERTYTLLIMLYCDLVPKTCSYFLNRCMGNDGGWANTELVRVVPQSWIQFQSRGKEGPQEMVCENYKIPHDRRGILSTCNYKRNVCSTNHFNISLEATPWMDRRYVAFGLVVQGEEVLREFEVLEVTDDHVPLAKIEIFDSNEFTSAPMEFGDPYLVKRTSSICDIATSAYVDAESCLSRTKYETGIYSMTTDLRSYMPFMHLPDFLMKYKEAVEEMATESATMESDSSLSTPLEEIVKYVQKSKDFLLRSKPPVQEECKSVDF